MSATKSHDHAHDHVHDHEHDHDHAHDQPATVAHEEDNTTDASGKSSRGEKKFKKAM